METLPLPQRRAGLLSVCLLWICAWLAAGATARDPSETDAPPTPQAITPIPLQVKVDPAKAALGRSLFFDKRLSGDGTLSCASCHIPERAFTDGRARACSADTDAGAEEYNVPTLLNVQFNFAFGWLAQHETLENQLQAVVEDPRCMDGDWAEIVTRLRDDGNFAAGFAQVYPEGVTAANLRDALVAFERTLITPDAPFDRYLRGERGALSKEARCGLALFQRYGCISCHQGANVGGNLVARLGLFSEPSPGRNALLPSELGRYRLTGREADRRVFRVPSLRNVALTAPYLHDGSAATLEEVVARVTDLQLGRALAEEELRCLVAFLDSLTGSRVGHQP